MARLSLEQLMQHRDQMSPCEFARIKRKLFGSTLPTALATAFAVASRRKDDEDAFARYLTAATTMRTDPSTLVQDVLFQDIVERASECRPHVRNNTVSAFADWLYGIYVGIRNDNALRIGKDVERKVSALHRMRRRRAREHDDWELVFRDPLTARNIQPFQITRLQVNGQPLRGIPDVVYRHSKTGHVVIVERKATNATIPNSGWPNLRAQLWAYAHIGEWYCAPEITLVGEIWSSSNTPALRRTLGWEFRDPSFYCENRRLFSIYGGTLL